MNISSITRPGFIYRTKLVDRNGRVLESSEHTNLVPAEGLTQMQRVLFKGDAAPANLYVGLYTGDYTPHDGTSASDLPATAVEFTGYSALARVPFVPGDVVGGYVSSLADLEFDFTTSASIRGAFVSTSAPKGSTSGTLWSVVRFPSPKPATDELKMLVTVGFALLS